LHTSNRWGSALGVLLAAGVAAAQSPAEGPVPARWESVASGGSDATDLATRCVGMPEAELQRMVSDAGSNAVVTRRTTDRSKPFIVATGRKVTCVRTSAKGFPLLPQEAFDKTVIFESMAPEQASALRTYLSNQLAQRGAVTALVKNELGNAVQLTYLFASESPTRMYYQASFLKAGEFDESRYGAVFTNTGPWTLTTRGQVGEQLKPLFTE
jgi:hypothetical protein